MAYSDRHSQQTCKLENFVVPQFPHFSTTQSSCSVKFGFTGYCDPGPGWLLHCTSPPPVYFCYCYIAHAHIHTHNCFTALWILSGTTPVSPYQKKYSPTHTYCGQQSSLVCFLHLLWSTASSLFNLHAWQSFSQSLSKFSLVYLLAWHPPYHTPYMFDSKFDGHQWMKLQLLWNYAWLCTEIANSVFNSTEEN